MTSMDSYWIPLQSVAPGGSEYRVDEQAFWQKLLDEFALDVRIAEPVEATVAVLPQAEGVLFRGRVRARVVLPCDRCSGDSSVELDHSFDSFEPFPRDYAPVGADAPGEAEPEEADEAVIRLGAHGRGVEINPAALAWEEFSLALPLKPLCACDCKGLCPFCGCDRNTESCSCGEGEGDPRLAPLRGLTIQKKQY